MSNCIFDFLLCREGLASRPRIYGESDAERLQIGVVPRARFFLWSDERSRKSCVCNDAIEREKAGCQTNTPEYDCTCDRVDSLSQRDQAGNASDDQREQTHRYQHSEDYDYFPCAGILGYGGGFHSLSFLLCTWHAGLQSKRGKSGEMLKLTATSRSQLLKLS